MHLEEKVKMSKKSWNVEKNVKMSRREWKCCKKGEMQRKKLKCWEKSWNIMSRETLQPNSMMKISSFVFVIIRMTHGSFTMATILLFPFSFFSKCVMEKKTTEKTMENYLPLFFFFFVIGGLHTLKALALLWVTTPSRRMTLGWSNWAMMDASARKSLFCFSV